MHPAKDISTLLQGTCAVVVLLLVTLVLLQHTDQVRQRAGKVRNSLRKHTGQHRIAVVIPFAGDEVPPYLIAFCQAARGSATLVDFILIHNGMLDDYNTHVLPENVKLVSMDSTRGLAERLIRVMDSTKMPVPENVVSIVTHHVERYPYMLVEFKPALGYIFQEELKGYTHWAYSDIDIAFGDLPRWITHEELTDFDIVTYGFGDQERVYLRGQFTMHKNSDKVNQIWRGCEYLSKMEERYVRFISGKDTVHFESAEGCYSVAIMQRTDIRVKYAVKAFTDVYANDTAYKHGLYIGIGQHRDRSVIYKAASEHDGLGLTVISPTWFEAKYNVYANTSNQLQREVGPRTEVERIKDPNARCMYWVKEKYQPELCVQGVQSSDTLFWIDGKLYKQGYTNMELPGAIISAPFFHFQEWKRYYRSNQLTTMDRSLQSLTWIMTKEGAIPAHQTLGSKTNHGILSPLGVQPLPLRWRGIQQSHREQLPHQIYCLQSGPRKFPPHPVAPGCERILSWQDQTVVKILNGALGWKHVNINEDVTLALTLQITKFQASSPKELILLLDLAVANVNAWIGQPCVLVICMAGATPEAIETVRDRMKNFDDICLVSLIVYQSALLISRKALLNMASDAAPTRWVVSGVEIERGMILSSEAALLANRRAKILGSESSANVLVIPQFGINDSGDLGMSISITELMEIRSKGSLSIKDPADFDKGSCDDSIDNPNAIFSPINMVWWRLISSEIAGEIVDVSDDTIKELALELEKIQTAFATMLTLEMEDQLALIDLSPILMVDNLGPQKGTRTASLAREVEEFGGKRCYNILRLAQLAILGYSIDVLPGAFAASTMNSRKIAMPVFKEDGLGSSRCDGCFMFNNKSDIKIVNDIIRDERVRPAKTAVIWNELNAQPGMAQSSVA